MDATARMLAVVSLLRGTKRALSWAEIRAALAAEQGYSANDAAARRTFERDKKALREFGYDLEWDAIRDGYRLASDPPRFALSTEEAELLLAAADLTRGRELLVDWNPGKPHLRLQRRPILLEPRCDTAIPVRCDPSWGKIAGR